MILNPLEVIQRGILQGEKLSVQQNSIDLHIDVIEEAGKGEYKRKNFYTVEASKLYEVMFIERVEMPKDTVGVVWSRSSTLRKKGIFLQSALYDSGFKGQVGAFLFSFRAQSVLPDERLATFVLLEANSRNLYNGHRQGFEVK
jgi:deoxycytidine triphosphate deaminase